MINVVNVKIPLSLLAQTIYILDLIDVAAFDMSVQNDFNNVLAALNKKWEALQLREAYSGIIRAKDDDSKLTARMRYLEQKRALRGDI